MVVLVVGSALGCEQRGAVVFEHAIRVHGARLYWQGEETMNPEFWLNRWQRSELGWHEDEFNRHLAEHWPSLQLPSDAPVLVPLCGKSLDILWLPRSTAREVR